MGRGGMDLVEEALNSAFREALIVGETFNLAARKPGASARAYVETLIARIMQGEVDEAYAVLGDHRNALSKKHELIDRVIDALVLSTLADAAGQGARVEDVFTRSERSSLRRFLVQKLKNGDPGTGVAVAEAVKKRADDIFNRCDIGSDDLPPRVMTRAMGAAVEASVGETDAAMVLLAASPEAVETRPHTTTVKALLGAVRDGARSRLQPLIDEKLAEERAVLVALGAPESLPDVDRRVDIEILKDLYEDVCDVVTGSADFADLLKMVEEKVLPVRRRALYAFAAPAIAESGRLPLNKTQQKAVERHYGAGAASRIDPDVLRSAFSDGPLCSTDPQRVLEEQIIPALWPNAVTG